MKRIIVCAICLLGFMTIFAEETNNNTDFNEGFESESMLLKVNSTGASSWTVDDSIAKTGKKSLHMKVNEFFPKNLVSATCLIPVDEGEIYQVSFAYKSKNIEKNPNLKHQPALPEARIILCDKKNKAASKPNGFAFKWMRSKFKYQSEEWNTISKIVKVPKGIHYLMFTIFDYHKGDLWIDDVLIRKL